MRKTGQILLAVVAVAGMICASAALAGTKYSTNVVPASAIVPTLFKKSKVKVKDNGQVTVILKGVEDADGRVTTDQSWSGTSPTISGDEYFLILKATFVVDATPFEVSIAVELKKGKGASVLSLASLFALIPDGAIKSVEARGADIYGPLGASKAEACQTSILTSGGIVLGPDPDTNPNPSKGGTKIGVAGIQIR